MPTVGTHADQWTRLDNARPCAIESSFLKPLREYTRRTVKANKRPEGVPGDGWNILFFFSLEIKI